MGLIYIRDVNNFAWEDQRLEKAARANFSLLLSENLEPVDKCSAATKRWITY